MRVVRDMSNISGVAEGTVQYCYPASLFTHADLVGSHWVCARTRPQWEKRFSRWLKINRLPHYLPSYQHCKKSHRTTRTTQLPLFSGYVFVAGDFTKGDFSKSDSVVRVLAPSCPQEHAALHQHLKQLWNAEKSGLPMRPVPTPEKGQKVEVFEGVLKGTIGVFQKQGRKGALILTVDMIGVSVTVELNRQCRYKIL
jgi:transcription antitermination factor NusG